jgi:MscS family membrane protein
VNGAQPPTGRLQAHGLLADLPSALYRFGPGGLFWWQWLALPLLLGLAWIVGTLLAKVSRGLLARIAIRTSAGWDDLMLRSVGGPFTLAWTTACFHLFSSWLELHAEASAVLVRFERAAAIIAFFWVFAICIDVARQSLIGSAWVTDRPGPRSLLLLASRGSKVIVLALASVALLSELGIPVASLVAGLGIGGLAVALAAQKTLENLFGAFAIGADQPFREGDFVRIDDLQATVEVIGLRSTRLRTLDRTLVTIPNGKLAEMRLETFAARDRLRLAFVLGLAHETTAAQMRAIVAGLESVLRDSPKIWSDSVVVSFSGISESSLNVEVMAWFVTTDGDEFNRLRAEVLLSFMEVIEREGSRLAMPARAVHLSREKDGHATGAG